jgi:hypothetical protein
MRQHGAASATILDCRASDVTQNRELSLADFFASHLLCSTRPHIKRNMPALSRRTARERRDAKKKKVGSTKVTPAMKSKKKS